MDKQYNPIEVEEKWVKIWSKRKVSNSKLSNKLRVAQTRY